jgi:hypothetical protein
MRPDNGQRWTTRELVDAVNAGGSTLSYSYFASLRAGARSNPDPSIVQAIARTLGVPTATLLIDKSDLVELADRTPSGLTPSQQDMVREIVARIAEELLAANRAQACELPAFTSIDTVTEVEVYVANDVIRKLEEASPALRGQLGQSQLAAVLDSVADRVRDYFTGLSAKAPDEVKRDGVEPDEVTSDDVKSDEVKDDGPSQSPAPGDGQHEQRRQ